MTGYIIHYPPGESGGIPNQAISRRLLAELPHNRAHVENLFAILNVAADLPCRWEVHETGNVSESRWWEEAETMP